MSRVWLFEIVEPYAPSFGVEVFSTLEKAKAYRKEVDWQQSEDGRWYEPHSDLSEYYMISPYTLDPDAEG